MYAPLVSVITPTYNHARYIGRAIKSLLAQTYSKWEMVIVDDGSTDNTVNVVKQYNDPRIAYYYQDNLGVRQLATTINSGLQKTKGELVTMFASDDTWPPYRLEKQVAVFTDPRVVLCFGRGCLIDENDRILGEANTLTHLENVINRPLGSALHEMFVSNFILQYTVLLRRSALDKIGGYLQPKGLLAEDYPTHMALALVGEFRYLDIILGSYRMHQSQMTRNHYLKMVETDIPYVMEFFRSLNPEMQQRTGWTEAKLAKDLSRRLNSSYFEVGRRDLLAGNWMEARRHMVTAVLRGDVKTKLKGLVGLGCCLLHRDMERIARISGRVPLR